MSTFDNGRQQSRSGEPQLTSFIGVGDTEAYYPPQSTETEKECTKIVLELNEETARYSALMAALGTSIDCDTLRNQLRMCRVRAWEHAKHAQNNIMPLIKKKKMKMEDCEEIERMYRVLSACLEFLKEQYSITLLLLSDFSLHSEPCFLISTGLTENFLPKKGPDKMGSQKVRTLDVQSLQSVRSGDLREVEKEDLICLQKHINEIHELVYHMNQSIAIQSWEVDPDMETDKFTVAIDTNAPSHNSTLSEDSTSEDNDHRRIRCVSIIILTVIVVIVGSVVGILMGVLD